MTDSRSKAKYRPVIIDWHDAASDDMGWSPIEDIKACPPLICRTIGFMVTRDKNRVVLVMNKQEEYDIASTRMSIPMSMINKVTYLDN